MKLTGILLLVGMLQVQAHGVAQTVTYKAKAAPLTQVFAAIKQQTGHLFFYSPDDLQGSRSVTCDWRNLPLTTALDNLFAGQPLSYEIQGNTVVVTKERPAAVSTEGPVEAVPGDIHGKVTDSLGNPLVGASVSIKGSNKGAYTDALGNFELKGVDAHTTIEVSFTGFGSKEYRINGNRNINIFLSRSTNPLDEVQIIAYGSTTKRLSTGDVSTIKSADIEKQPVSNALAAIEGRAPGLFITQSNGLPGSGFRVQIRGQNSLVQGNDPLYIIDGVPYVSQLLANKNPAGGNPLNFLNVNDIESIDILKDADATAIYGSRAASGAVLITTKKGKTGAAQVSVNANTGVGAVSHFVDLLNTQQYLQMRHEALNNDGVTPTVANSPDLLFWDTTRYTNWQKVLLGGSAHYDDVQANVSGGSVNSQYLIGGSYHRETTVFPGNFPDQKAALHVSLFNSSANQRFKLTFTGNYLYDNSNLIGGDATSQINMLPPDAPPVYNPDGSINWAYNPTGASTWTGFNPLAYLLLSYKAQTDNLVTNATASYRIVDGLEIKSSFGFTNMHSSEINSTPKAYFNPALTTANASSYFVNNTIRTWIIEPQLHYQVRIQKGKLDALVGTTFQQNTSLGQILTASGFSSDALLQNIQAAASITVSSSTNAVYKYNALFGRINYNYDDRYLVDFTARRDGSSRFGPENQFHNFGAVGAGWIFSNTKVVRDGLPWLSFGKLRGSYGTSGNDQVGEYTFMDLYNTSTSLAYQGVSGLNPARLYNPDLAWEVNRKAEGGLELGFLKDRVIWSSSFFYNRSSNELLADPLAATAGFSSILVNLPAVVQNKGWEFSLQTKNIKTKQFEWTSAVNLTLYRNKLIKFPGLALSPNYSNAYVIGQPITSVKSYHFLGVNDSTGVYQFATSKGQPTYSPTSADRISNVNVDPKVYGGIQNTFRYKGFQLDFLVQFVERKGINAVYFPSTILVPGTEGYQKPVQVLNRWQKPGDQKPMEKFSQARSGPAYSGVLNVYSSDVAYTDASYIRLKNASIAYDFPRRYLQKAKINQLQVYILAQNLFTLTNHYVGLDPETGSLSNMPLLRVVTAGVRVSL